ncbi:MAG: hypothetical protein ACLTK8_00185 [Paeniclostridium sp.]
MAISLCGFANISEYGNLYFRDICIMPRKRKVLSKLAFKAMIGDLQLVY